MEISDTVKNFLATNSKAKEVLQLFDSQGKHIIHFGIDISKKERLPVISILDTSDRTRTEKYEGEEASRVEDMLKELQSMGILSYKKGRSGNYYIKWYALPGELNQSEPHDYKIRPNTKYRGELGYLLNQLEQN